MVLRNFWYMFIWLGFATLLFHYLPVRRRIDVNGITKERWSFSSAILFFLPFIIWAGFRSKAYGDTAAYERMFFEAPSNFGQLFSYTAEQAKDKGYTVFTILFKCLFGNSKVLFFLVIASIQGICMVSVYRKYSCNFAFSVFLFVASTDYIAWMHNGMRQFLAVTVVFACIPLLLKKRYLLATCIALLMGTIHGSIYLCFPLLFVALGRPWNKRTVTFIVAVLLVGLFIDQFTDLMTTAMENTQYSAEIEDVKNDDGVNIFRVLVYSVPAILSFFFRRQIASYRDPAIDFFVNMSVITAGLYLIGFFTSGIMFGRLPILFSLSNYILLPWQLKHLFSRNSRIYFTFSSMALYMIFFYMQMHFAWGLI